MNDRDLEDVDLLVAGEDLGDRPAGARQPFRLTLRPYTDAGQAIDHRKKQPVWAGGGRFSWRNPAEVCCATLDTVPRWLKWRVRNR